MKLDAIYHWLFEKSYSRFDFVWILLAGIFIFSYPLVSFIIVMFGYLLSFTLDYLHSEDD